jgi:uncharacterized RDD family membrane protein YckC
VLTEEPAGGSPESPRVETAPSPHVGPDVARPVVPGSAVPLAAQPLQGRRAGLVTRILADGVDFAVVAGILGLAYLGVAAALFIWRSRTFSFPTPSFLLVLLFGGIVSVLYLTATWGTTGHSYGKHVLGLRVVGPFGRLHVAGAFVRAVLCVIFPVGLAWVLVSRHNRSLQDVVLRTSVVYDWLGEGTTSTAAGERG